MVNFSSGPRRFCLSLILSLLALASSSWGLACIRITITQTTNGQFSYQFDSNWLFTVSVILATLALVFTLLTALRFLKADRDVPYGDVVRTMAEIKSAGIERLGMITEPAPQR